MGQFPLSGPPDSQSRLAASSGRFQFYLFEFLFATFEELIVPSNFSAGVSDGSGAKVGQFGLLSIVSEQIRALKKVLAGWVLLFISYHSSVESRLSLRARNLV